MNISRRNNGRGRHRRAGEDEAAGVTEELARPVHSQVLAIGTLLDYNKTSRDVSAGALVPPTGIDGFCTGLNCSWGIPFNGFVNVA
jgi:hypothetical protein